MAIGNTTQEGRIVFKLKEGTRLKISSHQAKLFNDNITDAYICGCNGYISISINTDLDYGGFDEDGEELNDIYEYEFYFISYITIHGSYIDYPESWYDHNGDPGDPPSSDWVPEYGQIEYLDKTSIINDLKNIDILGDLIDFNSISILLKDYNDDYEIKD